MTDDQLIEAFRAGTLPADRFHHRDHVRTAWQYLREFTVEDAIARFNADLRRFAVAKGVPGLYHATITWAYLLIVRERIDAAPDADWDTFAAANPDLFTWKPSILDRYYTQETLWSDRARAGFVMPDK